MYRAETIEAGAGESPEETSKRRNLIGFANTDSSGIGDISSPGIPLVPPKPGDDKFGNIPGPTPISPGPGRGMNDTDAEAIFEPDPDRLSDDDPTPD